MYYTDKIHNHLCTYNIVYVLGLYCIVCFSDLWLFGYHIKEPAAVMMLLGFTFLGMTSIAQFCIEHRKKNIHNIAYMLNIIRID